MDRIEKALKSSIEKWKGVESGGVEDLGMKNCALCKTFFNNEKDTCGQCPVKKRTGQDFCVGTPYQAFDAAEGYGAFNWSDERKRYLHPTALNGAGARIESGLAKRLATFEREFLEDLLKRHRAKKRRAAR